MPFGRIQPAAEAWWDAEDGSVCLQLLLFSSTQVDYYQLFSSSSVSRENNKGENIYAPLSTVKRWVYGCVSVTWQFVECDEDKMGVNNVEFFMLYLTRGGMGTEFLQKKAVGVYPSRR